METGSLDATPTTFQRRSYLSAMSRKAQLESAYKKVVEEINNFCSRNSLPTPSLLAVSKYHPPEDIKVLYDLGHRDFGENYVQELQGKAADLPKDIRWHFIGNLQSNKAKAIGEIPNLAVVETIDSASKASKLNKYRQNLEPVRVYVQVNTSREPQKSGIIEESDIVSVIQHIKNECHSLIFAGLMTIGSFDQSHHEGENRDFSALVDMRQKVAKALNLDPSSFGLSMGMSTDFLQAIRQGSTNVRVGSSIFGPRPSKEEVKSAKTETK